MKLAKFVRVSLFTIALAVSSPASAGFDAKDVEVFVPTSAWLVGPATLLPTEGTDIAMPCVMMNQFNNGYTFRFSGGGGRMLAMALDFRQDAFKAGGQYDITVNIPPDYMKELPAMAHNSGIILVNLQHEQGFYNALRGGKYMYLTVADKHLSFALLGAKDGLERIESCYGARPENAAIPQPQAPQSAEPPGFSTGYINPSYRKQVAPDMPEPAEKAEEKAALTPIPGGDITAEQAAPAAESQQQSAAPPADGFSDQLVKKMEALDAMLANAAQRLSALEPAAGQEGIPVPVQPPAPVQPQVQAPKIAAHTTQIQPIGKPLAGTWMAPVARGVAGMQQRDIMVPAHAPIPTQAPSGLPLEKRWRAIRGTDLQEVLDVWSSMDNVRLIWQGQSSFSIEESMSLQGTFEQAVAGLLEQYGGESNRPLGRIYIDPVTGQKVLLVESR